MQLGCLPRLRSVSRPPCVPLTMLRTRMRTGGHTSEALSLLSALDFNRYVPRIYIISEGDTLSMQKAMVLEATKAADAPQTTSSVRHLLVPFGLCEALTPQSGHTAPHALLIRGHTSRPACPPVLPHNPIHRCSLTRSECLAHNSRADRSWPARPGGFASEWARDMFCPLYSDVPKQSTVTCFLADRVGVDG